MTRATNNEETGQVGNCDSRSKMSNIVCKRKVSATAISPRKVSRVGARQGGAALATESNAGGKFGSSDRLASGSSSERCASAMDNFKTFDVHVFIALAKGSDATCSNQTLRGQALHVEDLKGQSWWTWQYQIPDGKNTLAPNQPRIPVISGKLLFLFATALSIPRTVPLRLCHIHEIGR